MKYLALIFVLGMFSAAEANQCRRVFSSFQQRMRVAKPGVLERLRNSYLNVNPSDELKVFNLEDYDEVRSQPLKDIHLDNLNLARLRAGNLGALSLTLTKYSENNHCICPARFLHGPCGPVFQSCLRWPINVNYTLMSTDFKMLSSIFIYMGRC